MPPHDPALLDELTRRGVIFHAPQAVVVHDLDPDRIEAGVEVFPGVTLCGQQTLLRRGARLGFGGGGHFQDVMAGHNVSLQGGFFQDVVLLDDVALRGDAELRGGTLLEEGCEGAHHVGYKMTVMLPHVVAGSLVNLCDVLVSGGTSRRDHSEIGSCLALYNFTPWGDKFASRFGDVPRGVFLRSARVFIGGQTQIVSPVQIGFGAVIPAGCAVRRDVPDHRLYGEPSRAFDAPLDATRYGALRVKVMHTADFIAQLRVLRLWYTRVRIPNARDDLQRELYLGACRQLDAGVSERLNRLDKLVARLPASRQAHLDALPEAADEAHHLKRIAEHDRLIEAWGVMRDHISAPASPSNDVDALLDEVAARVRVDLSRDPARTYIDAIREGLDDDLVDRGAALLQRHIEALTPTWPSPQAVT